jgi:O-antigen/teichoic acid export membrane protein
MHHPDTSTAAVEKTADRPGIDRPSADAAPPDPPSERSPTRRGSAINASIWSVGGYGASQVMRLAGNVILARLLFPEAFGLMTLVFVFIQALQMFSDLGLGHSIIQNRRGGDPAFVNTAWTLNVLRGLLIWVAACGIAWPVASFYGKPELQWLLPVAGATAFISGFNSMAIYSVWRDLQVARVIVLEQGTMIAGVVVTCLWAWWMPTVWALVAGALCSTFLKMAWSHFLSPTRSRFAWDREAFSAMIGFGSWIFVSSAIGFLAMTIDRLVLGKIIPTAMLGVYNMAFAIAMVPDHLISSLCGYVIFPVLSEAERTSRTEFRERLYAIRRTVLPVGMVLALGMLLEADTFFALLYDERYRHAGHMAEFMTAWVWVLIQCSTLAPALLAIGDTRTIAAFNLTKFMASLALSLLGYHYLGLEGFLLGLAAAALIALGVKWVAMRAHGAPVAALDLGASIRFLLLAAASRGAVMVVEDRLALPGEVVSVPILITAGIWAAVHVRRLMKFRPGSDGGEPEGESAATSVTEPGTASGTRPAEA